MTLADAIEGLRRFEPGLYTIRFTVDGEIIELNRYTFQIDNRFSVHTTTAKENT